MFPPPPPITHAHSPPQRMFGGWRPSKMPTRQLGHRHLYWMPSRRSLVSKRGIKHSASEIENENWSGPRGCHAQLARAGVASAFSSTAKWMVKGKRVDTPYCARLWVNCVCMRVWMHARMCVCAYARECACECACMCACMSVYKYASMCVYMFICLSLELKRFRFLFLKNLILIVLHV